MKNLVIFFQTVRSALLSAKIEEDKFLRPKQLECLDHHLIQKQDLIAILPTGYCKSILFQVLHWLGTSEENNIVIVVVPLTSITRDKVIKCQFYRNVESRWAYCRQTFAARESNF